MRGRARGRAGAAAALAAGLVVVGVGCSARSGRLDATAEPLPHGAELQLASFDLAWQRIHETYPHADFRGLDWEGVRAELRPRAAATRTAAELRPVLADMLGRLGESHFQVIPGAVGAESREAAEKRDGVPAGDPSAAGAAEDDAEPEEGPGWLGLDVRPVSGELLVTRVSRGSPADEAGIRPGWLLRAVDGVDLVAAAERAAELVDDPELARLEQVRGVAVLLGGRAGSRAELELLHGGGLEATLELKRAPHPGRPVTLGNLPTVHVDFESELLDGGRVGYVRFNIWMLPIAASFTQAVAEFVGADADGVIIDLRGNPGGVGGMVMGLAGHFIREPGQALGVMTMRQAALNYVANPRVVQHDGPVAVLVDELSMSTSELFAAGMQGLGRARVFGTPTPGMALPSMVEELPNGDRLQYAIADLSGPAGRRIEGEGVTPDVLAPPTRERLLAGEDPALLAALEWIRSQAAEPTPDT